MDVISLAKINELKKSGGVGYSEPSFVLTYDGKGGERKQVGTVNFTKISKRAFDLSLVEKIAGRFVGATEEVEVLADALEVTYTPVLDVYTITAPQLTGGEPVLFVFTNDEGTWVIDDENFGGYVTRVHFPETIHTIDPKFLPTAKVINANECGIDLPSIGVSGQKQTIINDSRLFEEIGKQKDFVIECDYSGKKIALTPTSVIRNADGSVCMFTVTISNLMSGSMVRIELTLVGEGNVILVNCVTTATAV